MSIANVLIATTFHKCFVQNNNHYIIICKTDFGQRRILISAKGSDPFPPDPDRPSKKLDTHLAPKENELDQKISFLVVLTHLRFLFPTFSRFLTFCFGFVLNYAFSWVFYETSFDLKKPELEPKLVLTLSETRCLFWLFRFNIKTTCFGVSMKTEKTNRNKPKNRKL
jgi:hypothetical protein